MNPLQIFPNHPSAPDTYHIGGAWTPACITAVDKRFTDAELAAEYWQQALTGSMHPQDSFHGYSGVEIRGASSERLMTLHRFATLDHYDENPA